MSAIIANPAFRSLFRGLIVWAPLWIATTFVFGAIGILYAFFLKTDTFLASQALLVRDEANGAVMRLGRFQSQAEMKAAQETILEMSKSHQVIHDALLAVGKPPTLFNWFGFQSLDGDYPSKELVEETAKQAIQVHAPKGTEFGVTEVIYLDIKSNSTTYATALNKAVCDALEARLQQVRKVRADGVIEELVQARDSARRALGDCTNQLNEIERAAGADLTDLRGMTDTIAGGTTSRAEFDQIKNELRQVEATRQVLISDRELLLKATEDPTSFVVAPGNILNSHPGLKRLREGLVDAQIAGANVSGRFTDEHPTAIASRSAQESIVRRFVQELKASLASVDADISLANRKIANLEEQRRLAEERLSRLATGRASYANLLAEVKSRASILDAAERELAEAQAARDSSTSTSLLTRLDAPIVSDRPIGPGRTTLSGMCAIAGLVFGLGIVFVITPIDAGPTYGRRSVDRASGRRSVDTDSRGSMNSPHSDPVSIASEASPSNVPSSLSTFDSSPPDNAVLSTSQPPLAGRELSATFESAIDPRTEAQFDPPTTYNSVRKSEALSSTTFPRPETTQPSTPNSNRDSARDLLESLSSKSSIQLSLSSSAPYTGSSQPLPSKLENYIRRRTKENPMATEPSTDIDSIQKNEMIENSSNAIDQAFRELAKWKSMVAESPADESTIQSRVNELRSVLTSLGHNADTESLSRAGWLKPRATQ